MSETVRRVERAPGPRLVLATGLIAAVVTVSLLGIPDPVVARAACLAGGALVLWLSEAIPVSAVSLLLIGSIPLVLRGFGPEYGLPAVLGWAGDPVLALFFGGFALGAGASRHGLDAWAAGAAIRGSRGDWRVLLALVMVATAVLSMWMSNIAAAAMMLGAQRAFVAHSATPAPFRRALLVGTALAANFGGMATPIGTGPNAIAIAELSPRVSVSFIEWMAFAVPLTVGMLAVGYLWLVYRYRVSGHFEFPSTSRGELGRGAPRLVAVTGVAIVLWITEPLHHVPAAIVSLLVAGTLFASGLLRRDDLSRIDWSTLILIAGGITLGRLMEHSGLVHAAVSAVGWENVPGPLRITTLVFASATLSALMSNTATAVVLIPLAMGLVPAASTPVLVAIGASLGIPFVISTPPNAMVYGEGGVSARDLLAIGLPAMILGCLLVGFTGPHVLASLGLR